MWYVSNSKLIASHADFPDEHNGTEKCPQHGGVALSDPGAAERDTKDVAVDCKCGSDAQHCPCPSGTCRCANCAKNMAALRDPPR